MSAESPDTGAPGGEARAPVERTRVLDAGMPAPWFSGTTRSRPDYAFDTVAGRHVLLCFPGRWDASAAAIVAALLHGADRFDDRRSCFFGVQAGDVAHPELPPDRIPGVRFFLDPDMRLCRMFGTAAGDGSLRRIAYLLDPALRVAAVFDLSDPSGAGLAAARRAVDALPAPAQPLPAPAHAPVLVLPDLFEPALCSRLIACYEAKGGTDSGFMREVDGLTVGMIDHRHKRRQDCLVEDDALKRAAMARIHERLVPQMERAFQFRATRMERYIVACYDAAERGMFRPHRDNTTRGTAHRRFALSLFLNDDYEGGQLVFPEYGPATYRAPAGGGVVFSCSILHEALPVTAGRRYMFLPFLYDEAARRVRTANLAWLGRNDAFGGQ
ncbi:MAG: 2OG-Fe(II) oxygenase [bacterium]|nr:2OG-Fe(II) oxygenase [Betaproteobacteria bacterium]